MSSDTHTIRLPRRMRRLARSETAHRADTVTTAQPSEAASQRGRLSRVADDVSVPVRGEFRHFAW